MYYVGMNEETMEAKEENVTISNIGCLRAKQRQLFTNEPRSSNGELGQRKANF